jgi:prepilin-type N-terminal cleavage/methylation domain-containing protein
MKTKSGFTLIEMLSVIACIAILASLLLPALSRGREKARGIQCLNNTKQLGMSYLLYASDCQDKLPFCDGDNAWCPSLGAWWTEEETWRKSPLMPYLGLSPKTWQCPSYQYFDTGPTAMNYSVNQFLGFSQWDPTGEYNEPITTFSKLDGQLSHYGSRFFLLMDWRSDFSCGSSFLIDTHNWNNPSGFQWYSIPAVQHNHSAAFVFVDGSASLHKWRDPRTWPIPFTDPGDGSSMHQPDNVDVGWIQQHSSMPLK